MGFVVCGQNKLFFSIVKSFLYHVVFIWQILTSAVAASDIRNHKLNDIVFMGLRAAIGVIFIAHGTGKFNPGFVGFLTGPLGFPPEMQIPIALAETVPGILLIIGIFTRFSSSLLSIVMLGAIFYVKEATSLTGDRGYEIDLILLAANLVIVVAGPGRVSLAHVIKKLPRSFH